MVSEKKMRDILRSVRAIGRNNAGVEEAAHLLAEAMQEGVVVQLDGGWLPPSSAHKGILWIVDTDIVVVPNCSEGAIADEERVSVIVTREGMGDGEGD